MKSMIRGGAVLLILLLAGCHAPDRLTFHISRSQIQQQLSAQFPIEKNDLLFTTSFRDPVVSLIPESNEVQVDSVARIAMTRDVAVDGRISLAGQVVYDPGTGGLYIRGIRLVDTHLDSVPEAIRPVVKSLGGLPAVDRLFKQVCKVVPPRIADVKLAQLPDDWQGRTAKAFIRSARVGRDGIDVEIGFPH
jgi:hypothetical protein